MKEVNKANTTNNTKIQMYKAIDTLNNEVSLFAVKDEEMAVSTYLGKKDPWLTQEVFERVLYMYEPLDLERIQNPVLIWESEINKD